MDWQSLQELRQLNEILAESQQHLVLIFKHSTRCNISRSAFDRLKRRWNVAEMADVKLYYLDLISYREISNQIAAQFQVEHQSPQILLISGGKSVLDLSHYEIDYDHIRQFAKSESL